MAMKKPASGSGTEGQEPETSAGAPESREGAEVPGQGHEDEEAGEDTDDMGEQDQAEDQGQGDEQEEGEDPEDQPDTDDEDSEPDTDVVSPGTWRAEPPPVVGRAAPIWIFATYLAGLVLVFLGERVLAAYDWSRILVSGAGVGAAIVATVLRFSPRFRVGGERRQIEQTLGALSVAGLLALVAYFCTTEWAAERLGLNALSEETFDRAQNILLISWVSLVLLSILPMVFAETAAYPMRHAERPESRRVRAAVVAGLTLAMAGIYGSLLVYTAKSFELKIDYSYFKTSEPSEGTRGLVRSLEDPVLVRVFFPDVNEVKDEVERYLRDLAKDAPKLQIEIQDRLTVPKLASELNVTQDGTIVLSRGSSKEILYLGTELDKTQEKLRVLDRDLQEKLIKLVRSARTVYLTVGHGELNDTRGSTKLPGREISILKEILRRENLTLKNLGIAEGLGREVPSDADLVLVLGPAEPLAPEEIESLRRYADRGGKVFVSLDPSAESAADHIRATPTDPEGAGDAEEPGDPVEGLAPPASGSAVAAQKNQAPQEGAPGKGPRPGEKTIPADSEGVPPTPPATTHLEELARIFDLRFAPALLVHDQIYLTGRRRTPWDKSRLVTNVFSSHASVTTLSREASRGAGIAVEGAGSLEKVDGATSKIDFAVRAMPKTYGDANGNLRRDGQESDDGSYNLAAAVTRPVKADATPPNPSAGLKEPAAGESREGAKDDSEAAPDGKKGDGAKKATPPEMRAFVLTDAQMLTDPFMGSLGGNQVLVMDAIRWLIGEESLVAGLGTTEEDKRIEHTQQEDLVWFYSTIFGVPGLVLGLGLLLGRRGQRKAGTVGQRKPGGKAS